MDEPWKEGKTGFEVDKRDSPTAWFELVHLVQDYSFISCFKQIFEYLPFVPVPYPYFNALFTTQDTYDIKQCIQL